MVYGEIEVTNSNSQSYIIREREGVFIGEISALTQTQLTSMVRTTSESVFCMMNAAEFDLLITQYPMMAMRLITDLSDRLLRESTR